LSGWHETSGPPFLPKRKIRVNRKSDLQSLCHDFFIGRALQRLSYLVGFQCNELTRKSLFQAEMAVFRPDHGSLPIISDTPRQIDNFTSLSGNYSQ
jgi:hypothetical protein